MVLSKSPNTWSLRSLNIPLGLRASYLCLAQFCDWDEGLSDYPGVPAPSPDKLGQVLAEVSFIYEDGSQRALPIRRRFETNAATTAWGFLSYGSRPHLADTPRSLTDPLERGTDWGELQDGYWDNNYPAGPDGRPLPQLWVCALENPEPEKTIQSIHVEATDKDPWVICGLTAFKGKDNPLRHQRLGVYELSLPAVQTDNLERWKLTVDLGVIIRTYTLPVFSPSQWLASPRKGLGERERRSATSGRLLIEMAASPDEHRPR